MEGLHGSAKLARYSQRGMDIERRTVGYHLAEPTSLDELGHSERLAGVELAELQHPGHRGMRRRSRNAKDLRRLQGAREVTRQEADRNTMAGRLVLAEADGPEGTGTDLADDAVPATHAQAAREPLPALGGRDRRRTRLGFSTHGNNPSATT